MRSNAWNLMTDAQWWVMALAVVAGVVIALTLEWLARPRVNKWSDWGR